MSDQYEGGDEPQNEETSLAQRDPQAGQMLRQDFSSTSLSVESAATAAIVAKARADIEARWVMAMRRPRNPDNVRQLVLRECQRPGFAEAAIYKRPAGREQAANGQWVPKHIEGLSIRFAEVAMRCMGNMPCETQTIFDSHEERIIRVTVTDLEANVTWSRDLTIKKTVERKQLKKGQRPISERVNSYGDRVFIVEATDDDVNMKEAAAISKAARTLILRCVPGNIQDEAKALCKKIAADKTAKDPAAARNAVFDAFATIAVMPPALERYLGHPLEQASPAEIEELRSLFVAIRDGEATWADSLRDALEAADDKPNGKTAAPAKTSNTEIAEQTKPEPTKPPRASGRGTAALKDATKPQTEPAKPNPPTPASTPSPRSSESTSSAGDGKTSSTSTATSLVAHSSPPSPERSAADDLEERACADCGLPIETRKSDPPGARCYACANA